MVANMSMDMQSQPKTKVLVDMTNMKRMTQKTVMLTILKIIRDMEIQRRVNQSLINQILDKQSKIIIVIEKPKIAFKLSISELKNNFVAAKNVF